jgi:hypothetical protein
MMDEITETEQYIYDLRVKIKRQNAAMGRMFEKGLITSDMIAEALDEDRHEDQFSLDTLKVIYCSWGGDQNRIPTALRQFDLIIKTIRSYQ